MNEIRVKKAKVGDRILVIEGPGTGCVSIPIDEIDTLIQDLKDVSEIQTPDRQESSTERGIKDSPIALVYDDTDDQLVAKVYTVEGLAQFETEWWARIEMQIDVDNDDGEEFMFDGHTAIKGPSFFNEGENDYE